MPSPWDQWNASPPPVTFEVGNNMTRVLYAPPAFQQELNDLFSYATQTADALRTGWRPPEAEFGEGYWDGYVRLSKWWQNGTGQIPTGLLKKALRAAERRQIAVHVSDLRKRPEPGVPDVPAIPLRKYQERAVEAFLRAGSGVLDQPPRSGKTRTGIEVVRQIWLPTIWIAPTKNIVEQTTRAFDDLLGKNFALPLVGSSSWRKSTHARVHVCTSATAASLPEEYFQTREVLLIDEVHHGASPSYHSIAAKCEHIYWRLGMTGTFGRSGNDEVALHALMSDVVYKISTTELVELGFLAPMSVAFLPVDTEPVSAGNTDWQGPSGFGTQGVFKNEYRNQLAAWVAATLFSRRKRTLVLVGTKPQGDEILRYLKDYVPNVPGAEFKGVEFVSTNRPSPVNRRIIDSFASGIGEVQLLIGTSLVGEGTDLPTADALVYAMGGKAEVSHKQAQFRVCTATPEKKRAIVVDFADRHHKTLMNHSLERASTYFDEPIAEHFALSSVGEFPAWLDWIGAR